ncbi:MAG: MGMT family protein [Clostridia bacterium]|nr:MGMT family protein [Clostridia bacterium]
MTDFQQKVYSIVKLIPQGKVTTYSAIAKAIGSINYSRAVGNALHKNQNPNAIPCYRVVNSKGKVSSNFAFGGKESQIELLTKDCIVVSNGYVNLKKYFWNPCDSHLF